MTEKTEEQIAREKEAVQKMIGAKGAMQTSLDRIETLERQLELLIYINEDIAKNLGDGVFIRSKFNVEGNFLQEAPRVVQISALIRGAVAKARAVL